MFLSLLAQVAPPDWSELGVLFVQALVPIVTVIVVYLGRLAVTKIPRFLIPIVAVAVATVLDALVAYYTGGVFNPVVGALLGAAAVWIREFLNTISEHGLDS